MELRIKGAAGPVHVQLEGTARRDDSKRIQYRLVLMDISASKEAEKALREKEEQLRIAVEGGRLGTWNRDLISGKTTWNPYLYELLGRDPDGFGRCRRDLL